MFLTYFTEQPMSAYDEQAGLDAGYTAVLFSNEHYDPRAASQLFEERKIEYILAEQAGFDGIMVNEHHNAPFCMQPQISVWSSVLAAITERVKIVQLGNPLPIYDNPLQFAETAMGTGMQRTHVSMGNLTGAFGFPNGPIQGMGEVTATGSVGRSAAGPLVPAAKTCERHLTAWLWARQGRWMRWWRG